jgi:hypothetical protein
MRADLIVASIRSATAALSSRISRPSPIV